MYNAKAIFEEYMDQQEAGVFRSLYMEQSVDVHTDMCVETLILLDGPFKAALGKALVAHDVLIFGGAGGRICFQVCLQGSSLSMSLSYL
jgi:hypothetical protein